MANLNKVFLLGNLTRDPEVRQLPSGTTICSFGMAINRNFTTASGESREEVCFVDLTAMGRQAETIAQYMRKGSLLFVEGRLHFEQWDDRETGKKRNRLSVQVERAQFMGPPAQPQTGSYQQQPQTGGYQQQAGGYPPPQQAGGYPPPQQAGGYPPPQQAGGYPPPQQAGGYPPPPVAAVPSRQSSLAGYGAPPAVPTPPAAMPAFKPLPEQPPSAGPSAGVSESAPPDESPPLDDIPF